MKFELSVESREGGGKGPARQLRRAGRVPAVLYGQGECLLLSVKPEELVKILRAQAGSTALISITINGAKSKANRTALLRDYQVDPIAGSVLHADFFEVAMDKPIRVKVPVHLTGGQPLGLKGRRRVASSATRTACRVSSLGFAGLHRRRCLPIADQ